jgi:NADH-quinone oxidoreductase subunit G
MLNDARKAYMLLGAEPEFDCASPVAARAALEKAAFAVILSPFRHGTQYADALLPVAPFTETAGTFVNCEGRAQRWRREARAVSGVEGASCWARAARASFIRSTMSVRGLPDAAAITTHGLQARVLFVHSPDPLARRASLRTAMRTLPPHADRLTMAQITGRRASGEGATGPGRLCDRSPTRPARGVIRIAAAHASTCSLDGLSGPVTVEKA